MAVITTKGAIDAVEGQEVGEEEIARTQETTEGKITIEKFGKENNQNSRDLESRIDVTTLKLNVETEARPSRREVVAEIHARLRLKA